MKTIQERMDKLASKFAKLDSKKSKLKLKLKQIQLDCTHETTINTGGSGFQEKTTCSICHKDL